MIGWRVFTCKPYKKLLDPTLQTERTLTVATARCFARAQSDSRASP
jgi:hypothetical protein